MNTAKAKEILQQLDIQYVDVKRGTFLYVIMKDGSHIPFNKLIREHKKHVSQEASDLLFSPTPLPKEVDTKYNVDEKAETEILVKKPRKKFSK